VDDSSASGEGALQLPVGCVQVYTGDGKGKTTAALGLALRASGHGLRSYIGQFMKGQDCGEHRALRHHASITLEQYGDPRLLRREDVTPAHIAQAQSGLARARQAMLSGEYQIIILDEVNVALWYGMLSLTEVLAFLELRPAHLEVVLTGRRAPQELLARADLVTEMCEVKHYYARGLAARRGIES
jgi:cob(I)alamin adenosyltransferase